MMELFRLYAFSVTPQRTGEEDIEPEGGSVSVTADLKRAISENAAKAAFDSRTGVDFQVDPSTRTNETRDQILNFGFGENASASAAAIELANRLSRTMDRRSTPCLFVLASSRMNDRRRVTLWTFPRDEAFRFDTGDEGTSIEILNDIFSQTSRLRKAARFEGRRSRAEFLSGRVLDFQASQSAADVANFWIEFLECTLALRGGTGTRLLATTLRTAYEACDDPADQEQIALAIMSVRRSPRSRWSLQDVAREYLDAGAQQAFLIAVRNIQSLSSSFDLDRDEFDRAIRFRIFKLDTGVWVSSPLDEIGNSVTIDRSRDATTGGGRQLSCTGGIVEEKVRSKHA